MPRVRPVVASMALEMKKQSENKTSSSGQLVISSQRTRSQEAAINTNSYILNKVKALRKKLAQCAQVHISYEMKPNKNFVMRLSPAAYELTRYVIIEQLYSDAFSTNYSIQSSINEDECQHQVGSVFRVFNKKKDGSQGIYQKFTINFYHTTSTILVNGNRTEIFENTLFEPICAEIERNGAKLSIVNEQISMTLSEVENQTISDDKNPTKSKLKSIGMECKASDNSETSSNVDTRASRHNLNELDTNQCLPVKSHSASENEPNHTFECPVCEQTANGGTIVCEECSEWYHFSCIGLPEARVDSIPNDVPFICQFCNDNQLYTDSLMESQPTVNISDTSRDTESLVNTKDCNDVLLTDITTGSGLTQATCQNVLLDDNILRVKKHALESNCNAEGNKKFKARKGQNNGSKKQGFAKNQETLVAQKYYISSLEGKINHLENTVSVLQKAIENGTLVQNLSNENNTSQNQQSNQKQCFCTGPEDIKYKLLENRLLILENHNQVMNAMYIQNQMQTALRESQSTGNIHVPQPVFGVQPTTMSYAPFMPPAYPQFFQWPMPMNHHIIQPVPNVHIPGIQPVQPTVIPVPISQQRVVYPTSMMPGQHVRPSGIPVPINHQHIYPTAPPSNLHTAMGKIRLNPQHTAAPTEQGVQQRLVPNRAESGARVDGEQIRAQQPSYPLPTSTCMAMRQERKRLHEHSAADNIDGQSPTKISKVSDTIDLCTTPVGSSMINIQTTLERSSRSDQCTTPARLPSTQAKVLTLSHLDSPVIGHDQCTVARFRYISAPNKLGP